MADTRKSVCLAAVVATALGVSGAAQAAVNFVEPSDASGFDFGFTAEDTNTTFAQWDFFTIPQGGPNLPDVGSFNNGSNFAVTQNVPGAFITTGGNIYSFSVATDFDVSIENNSDVTGTEAETRVVVQWKTLGNLLDYGNIFIEIAGDPNTYTPDLTEVLFTGNAGGGFGGADIEYLAVFDLPGAPGQDATDAINLNFNAQGTSMSLDELRIDTFASDTILAGVVVPEPASLVLLGAGALLTLRSRRSAEQTR